MASVVGGLQAGVEHVVVAGPLSLEHDMALREMEGWMKEVDHLAERHYPAHQRVAASNMCELVAEDGVEFLWGNSF